MGRKRIKRGKLCHKNIGKTAIFFAKKGQFFVVSLEKGGQWSELDACSRSAYRFSSCDGRVLVVEVLLEWHQCHRLPTRLAQVLACCRVVPPIPTTSASSSETSAAASTAEAVRAETIASIAVTVTSPASSSSAATKSAANN